MREQVGAVFLWGMGEPRPDPAAFTPRSDRWWRQYDASLHVTPAARAELARSSREIVGLLPDPRAWGDRPRPFKGLVAGAVQSGKTASMMGVAAVALDQGFRIVIVLAGGKDDLRQQTARRFNSQLLRQSDLIPNAGGATTLAEPARTKGPLGGFAPPYAHDANQFPQLQHRLEMALTRGEPVVLVVKKNVASLGELRSALHYCYSTFGVESLPTLVFDDECDDASVDAAGMPIPESITNLWRRAGAVPPVAYLGYTATAAANLLQSDRNELFPSHFAFLLRYPGETATALQFAEPVADAWYCGGECFYREFGDDFGEASNFLMRPVVTATDLAAPVHENPSLVDAVRAYVVAGAYRLALEPDRRFDTVARLPRPHSMLVQTSASTDEHTRWFRGIAAMFGGQTLPDRSVALSPDLVEHELVRDESPWVAWFDRFDASRERVYQERPHTAPQRVVTWPQVRGLIRSVVEHARLKIVNSDPGSGGTLSYAPGRLSNGDISAPQDIYVIAVGGSKLSRGLTLEGLCISYFTRWNPTPTEDTVLQMARWFGYRGPHLEFCRIFTSREIADNLRQMQENDTDLRDQLAELMAEHRTPQEASVVICANPRALPTGKMGEGVVRDLSFSPYAGVFSHVEVGAYACDNQDVAGQLVAAVDARAPETVRTRNGVVRGKVSRGWTAIEVADWLDAFSYSGHNPDSRSNLMRETYRPHDAERATERRMPLADDPYQVAAYLRSWTVDAKDGRRLAPPRFAIGYAYGELLEGCAPFTFPLMNRRITVDGILAGGWTGRSTHWDGDAFFDGPPDHLRMQGSQQRLSGADGLLLLYLVHRNARGRSGDGVARPAHTPTLGISIPVGGPAFRRVLVETRGGA